MPDALVARKTEGIAVPGIPPEDYVDRARQVLLVASRKGLMELWQRHLERCGLTVEVAASQDEAVERLERAHYDLVILDLLLSEGSALAVGDILGYRWPHIRVIPVTRGLFFQDGSILSLMPNACSTVRVDTPPADVAAIAAHYAASVTRDRAARSSRSGD